MARTDDEFVRDCLKALFGPEGWPMIAGRPEMLGLRQGLVAALRAQTNGRAAMAARLREAAGNEADAEVA